jgi:hypothetical protein
MTSRSGTFILSSANDKSFQVEVETKVNPNSVSEMGSIVGVGVSFRGDLIHFGLEFFNMEHSTARLNGMDLLLDSVSPQGAFFFKKKKNNKLRLRFLQV